MGRRAKDIQGAAIIVLCAVAAVIVGVWMQHLRRQRATPPHAGSACAILLIDETDPFTAEQRLSLHDRVGGLVAGLTTGERLEVWTLGSYEEGALRRRFDAVVPERSSGWLTGNEGIVQAHFDSVIAAPLLRLVDSLGVAATGAPVTPLAEAVEELSELPSLHAAKEKRLAVASDLIQHSPLCDQYRVRGSDRAVKPFEGTRLDGVVVELWYLTRKRDAAVQSAEHRRYWNDYFHACGADTVTLERL